MAGSQVTVVANQIEKQRLGYQAISLTNYDNTSEPQIAAGSKVEIGDALFEFTGNESITGWSLIAVSSDAYIKLTVAGSSVTASFTTVAPAWDTAKQGWYSGSERYIAYLYKDGSGNYAQKRLYFAPMRDAGLIKTAMLEDLGVTVAKLNTGAVTTPKIDTTSFTTVFSNHALVALTPWVPPAGLYMFFTVSTGEGFFVEIYTGSTWLQAYGDTYYAMALCDGVNVRLYSTSSFTVYWRRLG